MISAPPVYAYIYIYMHPSASFGILRPHSPIFLSFASLPGSHRSPYLVISSSRSVVVSVLYVYVLPKLVVNVKPADAR